jgi:ABC-type methionine transport system ATPase subunit
VELEQIFFQAPVISHQFHMSESYSKRVWLTFPTRSEVEQPIIWQMSRKYPEVTFDIRQASVQNEIGIMAVLLSGKEDEVQGAIQLLRSRGVTVEPIEKSVVEG